MIKYTGTYTDFYQLTMAQVYFLKKHHNDVAVFDYFFRKLPFKGGYAIFAGLESLLEVLENLHFDQQDIDFLGQQGFHPDFLNYLKHFKFTGTIYSSYEGDVIFPTRPILIVEAPIVEAQIIETMVLNFLNFQILIATKASRLKQVAGHRKLMDFGLRRAQGPGGYYASRAAIIGGVDATSNVLAGRDYEIPLSGTMAHSFIQSYDSELSAFRDFAECWPDQCILLVDTYSTLNSGIPNAIQIAKELKLRGHQLRGVRIDSGDLAHLSKQARQLLDNAQLQEVKIIVSNQLDEYVIKSLLEQEAPIDAFGVGTNLTIGVPDSALDGVYKLAMINKKPTIKLSETIEKITLPYKKQVYRVIDSEHRFAGIDIITLAGEKESNLSPRFNGDKERLLHKVMEKGRRLSPEKTLKEIAQYSQQRLQMLPVAYKRFINPHIYKIELSEQMAIQRHQVIKQCP